MLRIGFDAKDAALIKANARIMQLHHALVKVVDAHDAPEPVRQKAIDLALSVARALTS